MITRPVRQAKILRPAVFRCEQLSPGGVVPSVVLARSAPVSSRGSLRLCHRVGRSCGSINSMSGRAVSVGEALFSLRTDRFPLGRWRRSSPQTHRFRGWMETPLTLGRRGGGFALKLWLRSFTSSDGFFVPTEPQLRSSVTPYEDTRIKALHADLRFALPVGTT